MDSSLAAGSSPPPGERIVFRGDARTYFRIWLVNLTLTIVTFGVWSAWAKVRRNRYFYGNTRILGDPLDYTARGWTICKGRLLAAAVVGAYYGMGHVSPTAQGALILAWLPIIPWVVNRALAFNGFNTVWRNVRFHWHGTYWGTARAYFLWPLVIGASFFILLPFSTRATRQYVARHYAFGIQRFEATMPLGPLYRALGLAALLALVTVTPLFAAAVVLAGLLEIEIDPRISSLAPPVAALVIYVLPVAFYRARARNVLVGVLQLGGVRFTSDLSGLRLAWIMLSNFIAVIASLGLLIPWAQVRLWRCQCTAIAVDAGSQVATFVDAAGRQEGAFAEEFADIGSIGLGV